MNLFSQRLWRLAMTVGVVLVFTACAGSDKSKQLDLGPNTPLVGVRSAWVSSIGPVDFPLDIRQVGNLIFVASSDGTVAAIDARTGGDLWRTSVGAKLSAGVGSDGRYAAVVSKENELVVLDGGKILWRQKLGAVTLTAPFVAGARVFAMSADRTVSAFDVVTGRKLWQQQRTGEALVLGRSGIVMSIGDTLVVGLSGRVVGMNPSNGKVMWEVQVANSRGTNEVERLVDLVSGVSRQGNQVCVRAFQSAIGCLDGARGSLIWSKSASGSTGIDGDEAEVFGTESDGRVVAWKRADGERLWTSERLRFRNLSGPVLVGRSIVIGDEVGTLHFLSRLDGSPLNRVSTDGSAIRSNPILVGQTLVAVTQRGGLYGFKPE